MRRVLILMVMLCSVVVGSGVASAQSIPSNLYFGYFSGPGQILTPSTEYYLQTSVENDGGGDATLSDGQTLASFQLSTVQNLGSSCNAYSDYGTFSCETAGNVLRITSAGQSTIPKNTRVNISFSYTTPDDEGYMRTLGTIDPDNSISELRENDNVRGPIRSFVGSPGETDLSVSVTDREDPVATRDDFGQGASFSQIVRVKNEGDRLASGTLLTIKHSLGSGAYIEGVYSPKAKCYYSEPDDTRLCDIGYLVPDQEVKVNIIGYLSPSAPPQVLRNEAKVTHNNADPESGNDSAIEETTIVDGVAPQVEITSGPKGVTESGSATFEFRANEPNSTFECSLDRAGFAPCASPKTYSYLSNGRHELEIRATDEAGNVGDDYSGLVSRYWTVKLPPNKPPTVSAIPNQTLKLNKSTKPVKFTVADSDGPVGEVKLKASSSNATLIPPKGVVLSGTGANRTVKITPAKNKTGTARITLTATDSRGGKATRTFVVNVKK